MNTQEHATLDSLLWFRLLLQQRNEGTGLTLPFLIGATQLSTGSMSMDIDAAYRHLASLLTQMRDSTPYTHTLRADQQVSGASLANRSRIRSPR
jgi:hypothetical protein